MFQDTLIIICDLAPLLAAFGGCLLIARLLVGYVGALRLRSASGTFWGAVRSFKGRLLFSPILGGILIAVCLAGGELALDRSTRRCDIHKAWATALLGAVAMSAWTFFVIAPFFRQRRGDSRPGGFPVGLLLILGQLMAVTLFGGLSWQISASQPEVASAFLETWIPLVSYVAPIVAALAAGLLRTALPSSAPAVFLDAVLAQAATLWPFMIVPTPSGFAILGTGMYLVALSVPIYSLLKGNDVRQLTRRPTTLRVASRSDRCVEIDGKQYINHHYGFSVSGLCDWFVLSADVAFCSSHLVLGDLVMTGGNSDVFAVRLPDASVSVRIQAMRPLREHLTEDHVAVWKLMLKSRLDILAREMGASGVRQINFQALGGETNVLRLEFQTAEGGKQWRNGRVQALHDDAEFAIAYRIADSSAVDLDEILRSWSWRRRCC